MIEFTTAQDYRGRQDKRIEYREPVKIDGSPFDVSVRDVYLSGEPVRLYLSGDAIFSGMYLARNRHDDLVFGYTAAYDRLFDTEGPRRSVLMIGGAACTYPRHCLRRHRDLAFTVVDADPCAEEIARNYFFLDEFREDMELENSGRLRLITADGRDYLERCGESYDAILNDAFVGAVPVGSLATREAARRIRGCLSRGGVYMTNVLAGITGGAGRFLRAEVKTLREVFRHVAVYPTAPGAHPSEFTNWMLMASDAALPVPDRMEVRLDRDDPVLTDAYLPPAVLMSGANEL